MPQGGVDHGEDTWAAAKRELYEETSVRSVEKLGEMPDWLIYDIPREIGSKAWRGKYRGQRQKWYAVRFTGKDTEINVESPGGGHKAEFVSWRWEPMKNLPDLIVPFKRETYARVVKAFSKFTPSVTTDRPDAVCTANASPPPPPPPSKGPGRPGWRRSLAPLIQPADQLPAAGAGLGLLEATSARSLIWDRDSVHRADVL